MRVCKAYPLFLCIFHLYKYPLLVLPVVLKMKTVLNSHYPFYFTIFFAATLKKNFSLTKE